jgi:hypothetical protein
MRSLSGHVSLGVLVSGVVIVSPACRCVRMSRRSLAVEPGVRVRVTGCSMRRVHHDDGSLEGPPVYPPRRCWRDRRWRHDDHLHGARRRGRSRRTPAEKHDQEASAQHALSYGSAAPLLPTAPA